MIEASKFHFSKFRGMLYYSQNFKTLVYEDFLLYDGYAVLDGEKHVYLVFADQNRICPKF